MYTLINLLYETISIFEDIWTQCLEDLNYYRMITVMNDQRDRET